MPYKDCLNSYRIIKGIKYEQYADCNIQDRNIIKKQLKDKNIQYRVFNIGQSMYRIFTKEINK